MLKTPHLLVALFLSTGVATSAEQIAPGGFRVIVDKPTPHEGPLIINGCELKSGGACPGADPRHADLSGLKLNGIDLKGADLSRADPTAATLEAAMAPKSRFFGAKLIVADLLQTKFYNADFANATLERKHAPYAI